jgi:hypothetical protein
MMLNNSCKCKNLLFHNHNIHEHQISSCLMSLQIEFQSKLDQLISIDSTCVNYNYPIQNIFKMLSFIAHKKGVCLKSDEFNQILQKHGLIPLPVIKVTESCYDFESICMDVIKLLFYIQVPEQLINIIHSYC